MNERRGRSDHGRADTRRARAAPRAVERLLGSQLNADPDYFGTAIRGRDDAVRPHVLLLERAGEPRALAVGQVEEITLLPSSATEPCTRPASGR